MMEALSDIKIELLSSAPLRELEAEFQEVINSIGRLVYGQTGVCAPEDLENGSVSRFLDRRKTVDGRWTLLFTGPHGAGKTSVLNDLATDATYHRVLNHTTRSPREGERNAGEVIHVSEEEYADLQNQGLLVTDNFYPGRGYFGLTSTELERAIGSDKHLLMEKRVTSSAPVLEWLNLRGYSIGSQHILVLAPNFETHVERILARHFVSNSNPDSQAASLAVRRQLTEEKLRELRASIEVDPIYLVNDQVRRVADLVKALFPPIKKL